MVYDQNHEMYEASAKLCRAVEPHPCLYDRDHPQHLKKDATDIAWDAVAKQCGDTAESCRVRWRNIRSAFIRSIHGNVNRSRSSNRFRDYYLSNVLDFYVRFVPPAPSNGEPDHKMPDSDHESDKSIEKRDKIETDTLAEATEENEQDESEKAPAANVAENGAKEGEISNVLKRVSLLKQKIRTFYIKQKPTQVGTFIIKRKEDGKLKQVQMGGTGQVELEDDDNHQTPQESEPSSGNLEDDERRFRFRRACKRGLDKTMVRELRVRKREPDTKRLRRSYDRMRSVERTPIVGEIAKDNNSLKAEEIGQSKAVQLQLNEQHKKKVLEKEQHQQLQQQQQEILLPSDVVETELQVSTAIDMPQAEQPEWLQSLLSTPKAHSSPMVPQSQDVYAITVRNQGAQCSFLPMTDNSTAAKADDDFLKQLKPHLAEMNARQKLHFKKKIYTALLEVFDDVANFPGFESTPDKSAYSNTTDAAESVTGGEMRLMRELVSLVQANKTPDVLGDVEKETNLSPAPDEFVTASMPQLAAHAVDNKTVPSRGYYQLGNGRLVKVHGSTFTRGEGTDKRRIYRIFPRNSIPMASSSGVGTFIIPRTSTSAASPSDTLMLPLATNGGPVSAPVAHNNGNICVISKESQYSPTEPTVVPVEEASSPIPIATADTVKINTMTFKKAPTVGASAVPKARQIIRRYSICGADTITNLTRQGSGVKLGKAKIITTTANILPVATAVSTHKAVGPSNVARRLIRYKSTLPHEVGISVAKYHKVPQSIASTSIAVTATSTTPTAAIDKSMVASLPGFSQILSFKPPATFGSPIPVALTSIKPTSKLSPNHSALSPLAGTQSPPRSNVKPDNVSVERLPRIGGDNTVEKLKKFLGAVDSAQETAGIIASDDFANLTIKTEPLDE